MDTQDSILQLKKEILDMMDVSQHLFRRSTRNIDISIPQFLFLTILINEGELTIGDIAKKIGFDQGNVSNMCKTLIKKGWVMKHRNPQDERIVLVNVTTSGINIIDAILQNGVDQLEEIFEEMDDSEVKVLCRFVDRCKLVVQNEEDSYAKV